MKCWMAAVLATTLLGCAGQGEAPEPASATPPTSTAPAPDAVRVPDLIGNDLGNARAALERVGLEARVSGERVPCIGVERVMFTKPNAGRRVPVGTEVRVFTARTSCRAARGVGVPPTALISARALVALARGTSDAPRWSERIEILLGSRPQRVLSASEAGDRSKWRFCEAYAGLTCPFSPLDALAEHEFGFGYLARRPTFCLAQLEPLPIRTEPHVSIEATGTTCHGHLVIDVYVAASGIAAVDLRIGSF